MISALKVSDPTPQEPGAEVGISVDVSSTGDAKPAYTWTVDDGEIVRGQGSPAITYRVPDKPGTYNVRLTIEWDGQSVEKVVSIKVEEAATATPIPTPTSQPPTATPIPPTNTPTPKPTNTPQPTDTPQPPTSTPTPAPTNTPRPTPTPTATIDADPTVHDNFNNPAFDGSVNSGRLESAMFGGTGCSIQQQDGKVVFSSIGTSNSPSSLSEKDRRGLHSSLNWSSYLDYSDDLRAKSPLKTSAVWPSRLLRQPASCVLDAGSALATEVGVLEAIVYAEPGATGNYNTGNIQFATFLSADELWYANCGIFQDTNGGWLTAGLNVGTISSGEFGESYPYEIEAITYGQWYKFRIQLHPTTYGN